MQNDEFVPPNGLVMLIDATGAILEDYSYVIVDTSSIVTKVFKTLEAEDKLIYQRVIEMNYFELNNNLNACLAIWFGDYKMYMAMGWAYDMFPGNLTVGDDYILYDLNKKKLLDKINP